MFYTTEKFSEEQIKLLWEKYSKSKDIETRNELVSVYIYLVKIIAFKLRGIYEQYGSLEDIISEGIIALIDVIDKYDISKNVKFETYATYRIRGAMIDFVKKQDWTPNKVKEDYKMLKNAENELLNKLGRTPDEEEVMNFLGISLKKYNEIISNKYKTTIISFEEMLEASNEKIINLKRETNIPEEEFERKQLLELLLKSMNKLNEKEQLIISLYYKEDLKFVEIAEILNLTKSRISQIHTSALLKLQEELKFLIE